MKPHLLLMLFAGILLGFSPAANGQIADNEPSTNYLAVHCAISGGRMAGDYEEYGRKLAKTLSLLAPIQQERVFGFVPQPGATASIPDYNPEVHGSVGANGSGGNTDSSEGSDTRGSNPLETATGEMGNGSLNGGQESPGSNEGEIPPNSDPDPDPGSNQSSNNWFEGFLEWLFSLG